MRSLLARIAGHAIALFARFITAARADWAGIEPVQAQRIYFANHASNADFVLVWTVLPSALRARTRPVAASDYWLKSRLREFVGCDVFNAVLIDRRREDRDIDPMGTILAALDDGASLIIFPEGTRNTTDAPLLPFRSGIFNISRARPGIDLVPVWIENLNHVMPKGKIVPIPLLCTLTFGAPIRVAEGESREAFLMRAEQALLALDPDEEDFEREAPA